MISRLRGSIVHTDPKYIVLDVHGVGYKVFTTADCTAKIAKEKALEVTLWTYLAVRENAQDLYGFASLEELNFFELLITISGIGPKTALGILNVASVHSLEDAIQTGDTTGLTKISGIGKKMADKIVLELKDKVSTLRNADSSEKMSSEVDALEALKSLGYNHTESRDVLKKLDKKITDTGEKVKAALKILGK